VGAIADRTTDWLRRQRVVTPRLDDVKYFAQQSEVPTRLPRRALAVSGSPENPRWVSFECPCGTGHTIMVNLSTKRPPFWTLSLGGGGPSLSPSVNFNDAYTRCHFWVRDGRVNFTRDSRRRRRRRPVRGS
jgi:hypothetical protein